MSKVILKAEDLDGYLSEADRQTLEQMDGLYSEAMSLFERMPPTASQAGRRDCEEGLYDVYNRMGQVMRDICRREDRIKVYSFETPKESHGEASRLIAKLRDEKTQRHEFTYYTQRAYELLFNLAYGHAGSRNKNYLIVKTPVRNPVQNYAVHKIPNVDEAISSTVMCVMLRGALLPSIIMSKEIEEYSSSSYVTPFALFKIKRDERKDEAGMEYVLDLERSYFRLEDLDGKDLVFADPMNATGGSLVTVIRYLLDQGIKPHSIQCFNVISALKGALRAVRAVDNLTVYTLWMDPVLNKLAYIMPGLGDAGDRINGTDSDEDVRDMIRLIADYGSDIAGLYRNQIRTIERTVLRR